MKFIDALVELVGSQLYRRTSLLGVRSKRSDLLLETRVDLEDSVVQCLVLDEMIRKLVEWFIEKIVDDTILLIDVDQQILLSSRLTCSITKPVALADQHALDVGSAHEVVWATLMVLVQDVAQMIELLVL